MKIYFIASFGNFNKLPLGGGQTSSRRLLATLKSMNYDVTPIHRHPPSSNNKIIRNLQFAFLSIVDPIYFFLRLLFCSRRDAIVIYQGYLGKVLLPLEYITSFVIHCLRYKNIFYLKGGGTKEMYEQCNCFEKFYERRLLENYSLIMCEGLENIIFVNSIVKTKTEYLPNFTEDGFAPSTIPYKPNDRWNILYFGRVGPTKNVLLGLNVFDRLCQQFDNIYYTIVGGGPENYCKQVERRIELSPNRDRIKRIGRLSHDELKRIMVNQHFFLFPSAEPREGHSNALNEAMSFGLVPIVSRNNFLPSIVGNNKLVANNLKVEAFTSIISNVIESDNYKVLSKIMFERIQKNFTQTIIEKKLKDIIEETFSL